jgi:hypothetical protein
MAIPITAKSRTYYKSAPLTQEVTIDAAGTTPAKFPLSPVKMANESLIKGAGEMGRAAIPKPQGAPTPAQPSPDDAKNNAELDRMVIDKFKASREKGGDKSEGLSDEDKRQIEEGLEK